MTGKTRFQGLKSSRLCTFAIAFYVLAGGLLPQLAQAQGNSAAATVSTRYIPDDALAVAIASPTELMNNPAFNMFPIEVLRAQAMDQSGIDPIDITLVKAVAGLPGPAGPQFGVVVEFSKDVTIDKLLEFMQADTQTMQVGEYAAHQIGGQPAAVLHQKDARTLVLASAGYLGPMLKADNGTGPLPALVVKMPRQTGLTVVAVLEPIRPMISGLAMQQSQALPAPLQPLGEVPGLIDALLIHTALNGDASKAQLSMLCTDDNAATRLEAILNDVMRFGREIGIAEMRKGLAGSGESEAVQKASGQYANRVADMIIQTLTPTRTGRRVSISVESTMGIATTGVLVGLLLPAVQAAREAARRMNASNNIKQIMLAMHNYHDTYKHLPPPAIMDADGKPLLSWRVAILPFVEQQALYQQFHLDEPWDSEHNFPLSQILPVVYQDPSAPLAPGYTILQAVVGDETGLKPTGKTDFPDFTDGTSNSLLIVETNRGEAVPWSKPQDVTIDLEDPLASMGNTHPGGFHVGIVDGSVRFVTLSINPAVFRALLTRAGGEAVDF